MANVAGEILKDLGLDRWPPFIRDKLFLFALLAGVVVWLVLWFTVIPTFSALNQPHVKLVLLSIIYYPVLEEILFRGVVQGLLSKQSWGRNKVLYLSVANWLTSFMFVGAHFLYQSSLWAVLIIAPSLVYGLFRDRYQNTYPSIVLHMYYNAGFVSINLLAQ
jgi:membrane protease YdiL (CAAX protease family)